MHKKMGITHLPFQTKVRKKCLWSTPSVSPWPNCALINSEICGTEQRTCLSKLNQNKLETSTHSLLILSFSCPLVNVYAVFVADGFRQTIFFVPVLQNLRAIKLYDSFFKLQNKQDKQLKLEGIKLMC